MVEALLVDALAVAAKINSTATVMDGSVRVAGAACPRLTAVYVALCFLAVVIENAWIVIWSE